MRTKKHEESLNIYVFQKVQIRKKKREKRNEKRET